MMASADRVSATLREMADEGDDLAIASDDLSQEGSVEAETDNSAKIEIPIQATLEGFEVEEQGMQAPRIETGNEFQDCQQEREASGTLLADANQEIDAPLNSEVVSIKGSDEISLVGKFIEVPANQNKTLRKVIFDPLDVSMGIEFVEGYRNFAMNNGMIVAEVVDDFVLNLDSFESGHEIFDMGLSQELINWPYDGGKLGKLGTEPLWNACKVFVKMTGTKAVLFESSICVGQSSFDRHLALRDECCYLDSFCEYHHVCSLPFDRGKVFDASIRFVSAATEVGGLSNHHALCGIRVVNIEVSFVQLGYVSAMGTDYRREICAFTLLIFDPGGSRVGYMLLQVGVHRWLMRILVFDPGGELDSCITFSSCHKKIFVLSYMVINHSELQLGLVPKFEDTCLLLQDHYSATIQAYKPLNIGVQTCWNLVCD